MALAAPRLLRCLLFLLVLKSILAVDRSNFKTCEQSGFCKRLRGIKEVTSPYIARLETAQINATRISVMVENTRNKVRFVLELVQLADNTVRIRMREAAPIRTRFEFPIGDVLVSEPTEERITVVKNSETLTVKATNNAAVKYVIVAKPLRIDVLQEEQLVMSVNARGLLRFEHTRQHPDGGFASWFSSSDSNSPSSRGLFAKLGRFANSWILEPLRFAFGGHRSEAPETETNEDDVDDEGEELHQHTVGMHDAQTEGQSWNERGEKIGVDGVPLREDGEVRDQFSQVDAENRANSEQNTGDPDIGLPGMFEEEFKGHRDRKPYGPQAVGLDFTFVNFRHVYGIPEHADSLLLRYTKNGDPYRLYNLDVFEYELANKMALYASIPLMLAHSQSRSVGLFWLNPSETWIDVEPNADDAKAQVETHWMSETGNIDVFVLLGPRPSDLFRQYSRLTGTTRLPPLPSVGYHQSRWNYKDENDCMSVDAEFDEADIPYDVLWLDIEHTDGKRYFTWDKNNFPDPRRLVTALASKGRRLTTIIDPHIKLDTSFSVYTDARDKQLLVNTHDGYTFEGWCWPGTSVYLDFLNPTTRTWWASRFSASLYEGSFAELFTWNDMNEPSVFNGPEVTMHKDNLHFDEREHREIHNAYGFYVHMASYWGHLHRSGGVERPFVLTRSAFAGSQRFAAIWTGDNTANWAHLKASLPMVLSLNLVGLTFSGADIGGFFGNPDGELLTRWYQAAAFMPFFRAHAHIDTYRREPFLQLPEYRNAIRDAIRLRSALVPYWYTLFWLSERSGMPLVAPIWVHFPNDTSSFNIDDHFMVGPALLVRPILEGAARSVAVYMPHTTADLWYDVKTHTSYSGGETYRFPVTLQTTPVYQRGGTIVPRRERIRRSVMLGRNDPFTLWIALDKLSRATGELYIDDYHTFRYRTHKEYAHVAFTFQDSKLQARRISNDTKFGTDAWIERIVIMGVEKCPLGVIIATTRRGHTSVPAGPASLDFRYAAESHTVFIRRPGVNIRDEWSLLLN